MQILFKQTLQNVKVQFCRKEKDFGKMNKNIAQKVNSNVEYASIQKENLVFLT